MKRFCLLLSLWGFFVPQAHAVVITDTGFNSVLAGPSGLGIRFDDYVPNITAVNADTIASFGSPFQGFRFGLNNQQPVSLLVEHNTGSVDFVDATSFTVTSDIFGPRLGSTMTLRFKEHSGGRQLGVVSRVGFRLGSMLPGVEVSFLDLNNEVIDTLALPEGLSQSVGYTVFDNSVETSLIHAVRFTNIGSDDWLIGSFLTDPGAIDLAFAGLQLRTNPLPVPMPWLLMVFGIAAIWLNRRRGVCDEF